MIRKFSFLIVLSLLFHMELLAQATHATITGTVTDEQNQPVVGASVHTRNESTGFVSRTITNEMGEYLLRQLPLGKPYTVTASLIGHGTQVKSGFTLNQGDLLRLDFELKETTQAIDQVEVTANSLQNTISNFGAATSVTSRNIASLPVNGRNFTSLIDLSPLSRGNNLSGQLASSTNFTVDGMTARNPTSGGTANRRGGSYAVSMEAIREFKIVTNQYDVTYGRSGGGLINTVTKSGTNTLTGSAFMFGRTDWLSSPYDIRGNEVDAEFSTYQFGFSLGGPIVKDKIHFFVVWDRQADARPLQIADIRNPIDEQRYNVTQQSLDRYLDIARNKYGVVQSPQFGSFDKKRGTDAVFGRVDWQLNEKHLLTVRNNFVHDINHQGISDNSSINLYEVYSSVRTIDNSFLATLRSQLGSRVTNELKVQHLYTSELAFPSEQLPDDNIPRAIVERVQSTVNDKDVFTTIQLGGQRYTPEFFYNNVAHIVNNVYYNTNKIDYTFGADLMYTHMNSLYGSEMNGRFYFTGLDNFDNLAPYRYAREIALTEGANNAKQNILHTGLYAQVQTKSYKGLEVMAGLRADYTRYFNKPNFNQLVFDELGLRTDNRLATFQIQPRVQVTWDIGERQRDILRVGAGIFGSDINNYAMINNMVFDGVRVASVDIQGEHVPVPDFVRYRQDPSTAPGVELFDLPGVARISTINMNGADARIPTLYKANLSYNRFFTNKFKMGLSIFGSFARNNYMYVDANMVDEPFFRLSNEGNRGVFVPSETINTVNGATNWMHGRKSDQVGRVLELNSGGKIDQFAVVVDGTYQYYKDGELFFSYTWNDIKDNTSFNGDVANTATLSQMVYDDPRDLSRMSYSNNQFRNKVVVYGTLPTFYGFSVGFRYSGMGGTRYSVRVSGNVNGDFVNSNDLAYIFDPNDPNGRESYRAGIQAILDNPEVSQHLKNYLRSSFGDVAERNGGENGFFGFWDLRISKQVNIYKTQHVEISAEIFNVANLLNKEWGSSKVLGAQNIYSTRGFDAVSNTYNYDVNPNTGVALPSGNPYQIQLGLRYGF